MKFPKTIKTKNVYCNKTFGLNELTVKQPSGIERVYPAVDIRCDIVAVLAFTENNEVILVEQFRPATDKFYLEIPAGKVKEGETHRDAVFREFAEETPYEIPEDTQLELVTVFSPSVGYSNESIAIYYVPRPIRLKPEASVDFDEIQGVRFLSFNDIEAMVGVELQFRNLDGKTLIALQNYMLKHYRSKTLTPIR